MISVSAAQANILALADALPDLAVEQVDITAATGRILAEKVLAPRSQPPFAASAMDGYAVQWSDIQTLPCTLKIIGEAHAGRRFDNPLHAGCAVRIFTGAPVPDGADTVVAQEDTRRDADTVQILDRPALTARHIRPKGQDVAAGTLLAARGTVLDIRQCTFMAGAGVATVPVFPRPTVDLILCGDELKLPGTPLGPDDIVSTNGMLLAHMLRHAGADVRNADRLVPDNLAELTNIIRASTADIMISCGGASVGERDFVQAALRAAGATLAFWKIAMRPGKPFMAATLGDKIIIGLPGNPVSAAVCALLFAQPLVRARARARQPLAATVTGRWAHDVPPNGERADYVRASVDNGAVTLLPRQDSALLGVLAQADALAVRPAAAAAAHAGDPVELLFLKDALGA